jgi:hypothetical protein
MMGAGVGKIVVPEVVLWAHVGDAPKNAAETATALKITEIRTGSPPIVCGIILAGPTGCSNLRM